MHERRLCCNSTTSLLRNFCVALIDLHASHVTFIWKSFELIQVLMLETGPMRANDISKIGKPLESPLGSLISCLFAQAM